MSTEILSFNARVNIAYNKVIKQYPDAFLLGAGGNAESESTTDPSQIINMNVAFSWAETKTIFIIEKAYGEFGDPIVFDNPPGDYLKIDWPISMDLAEANAIKEKEYPDAYYAAGLVHDTYYDMKHPQFFFTTGSGHILVDTVTGEVTKVNNQDLVLKDEGLGITFNLKYEVADQIQAPARLLLEKANTPWGKFNQRPPREITSLAGHFTSIAFSASGSFWGPAGTRGEVWYRGTDPAKTLFKVTWDISNMSDNGVTFSGGSQYYSTSGGAFDPKSRYQIVNLEIKQIED